MPFFKRSGPEPTPDPDLPLTAERARSLRALVREAFAETGVEVVVHPGHVEDDQGAKYGLWNVAAACNDVPEEEWAPIVRAHVSRLGRTGDVETMSEDELRRAVYFRLVESASLPDPTWHPSADRYGDGLTAVLSVDLPETVSTPQEDFWSKRGGYERWRDTGRANVRALLISDDLEHARIAPPDGTGAFDVVLGESFFTASTALLPEDLARRFAPGTDASRGMLLVVPFRHQVAFRVLDGTRDGVPALNNLFNFAMQGFAEAPGPLSPHVFWVVEGRWRQVTQIVDGQPQVQVDEDLAAALGGLAG
jgi:hypothetical protein